MLAGSAEIARIRLAIAIGLIQLGSTAIVMPPAAVDDVAIPGKISASEEKSPPSPMFTAPISDGPVPGGLNLFPVFHHEIAYECACSLSNRNIWIQSPHTSHGDNWRAIVSVQLSRTVGF